MDKRNQLVQCLDDYLYGWEYGDIKRASIDGNAKLAGFILGSCFIDAMARFYYGVEKGEYTGQRTRYIEFVKKFLPQYDSISFYEDIRCGLVHSYAIGEKYVFTDGNKAGNHMEEKNGYILLNLEDFLLELEESYNKFIGEILNDEEVYKKALKSFNSLGIMQIIKLNK